MARVPLFPSARRVKRRPINPFARVTVPVPRGPWTQGMKAFAVIGVAALVGMIVLDLTR